MQSKELYDLQALPENADVLIYGAGGGGAQLLEMLARVRADVQVLGFVDTFKHDGVLCGRPIVNVGSVREQYAGTHIIIASVYFKEIAAALKKEGIEDFSIYIDYKENQQYFDSLCRIALDVENGDVRFFNTLPDAGSLDGAATLFNMPVNDDSDASVKERFGLGDEFMVTNRLDSGLEDIDAFLASRADGAVNLVDVFGDHVHLTRVVLYLRENYSLPVIVWKENSPIKSIVAIEQHDLVYLPIPKCGSSSVINLLRSTFEEAYDESQSEHSVQSAETILFYTDITQQRFNSQSFFTVTRNPYTRLASLYNSRVRLKRHVSPALERVYGDDSFETFIRFVCSCPDAIAEHHFKSQTSFLRCGDEMADVTVIPLEKGQLLQDYIRQYDEHATISWRNKSQQQGQDYMTQYYTPELIRQVNRRYAADFEIGGYEKL